MKFIKFSQIFDFQKKSNIKAGDGLKEGRFPFFTSSPVISKYLNSYQFDLPSIVFGTGGGVSIHLYEKPFSVSTDCLVAQIKPDLISKFDIRFIYYYLNGNTSVLEKGFKGSGLKHTSKGYINQIDIPDLSIQDQKRIVKILDKADVVRQKRKQAIGLLDDYSKSVYLEMFGEPVKNQKKWKFGTISDLVSEVKYGTSAVASSSGDFPYLRMNNITYSGELDISSLKYINLKENELEKYLAIKGDLLFNRTNSKELVGKTAVYDLDIPMAVAGYLIRVRTNSRAVPEYISGYLNSTHGKKTLENMCKSIVGMANINAKELQSIKILVPPIDLQIKYKNILQIKNELKQKMLVQSKELENQFQSIFQKVYFKDYSPEPAKIKVQRTREQWFAIKQGIGAVLEGLSKTMFERGEMVVAKYMYFLQEIYKIPFGLHFVPHKFGPYDPDIRVAITSSTFNKDKFFALKGVGDKQVYSLGSNSHTLLKYSSGILGQSRKSLNELLQFTATAKSSDIERLASVCKVIQDNKSTDVLVIQKKMHEWKPGKFTDSQIKKSADFILAKSWDKPLLS